VKLPIRVRLTVWYAALLAAILIGLGAFVVLQLRSDLEASVERDAHQAARHLAGEFADEGPEELVAESRTVIGADGGAQVLDALGRVVAVQPAGGRRRSWIPAQTLRQAFDEGYAARTIERGPDGERFRVSVVPVQRAGVPYVLVVARSLEQADASVGGVLTLLLLAGPAALAMTALGGWWLAHRALVPVDRMTAQAEQIGVRHLDERISVPPAHDEVARLARTLNAMLDRLQEGVDDKQRLIADASHELRSPLAVMRAEFDVSLRSDDLSPAARELLESAREEVGRMSRTVDDLLTLAQFDEGRLELLRTRTDLRAQLDVVARSVRSLADSKRLRLSVGGEPCVVDADEERMQQALRNLVDNAIKYSPPGGEVHLMTWSRDGEAGVTVADEGPGLPPEAVAHVFDRFYRTDGARRRGSGGSGLGLAICREVALAHGGRVWVESEQGTGSRFSIAVPGPVEGGPQRDAPAVADRIGAV
jgi:heavy metal sensor kinase